MSNTNREQTRFINHKRFAAKITGTKKDQNSNLHKTDHHMNKGDLVKSNAEIKVMVKSQTRKTYATYMLYS